MGFDEKIRKTVGKLKPQNPLQELEQLNANLRSLGVRFRNPMPNTFESLLVKLARAGVEALVVGGLAVCLNGYVRTTQDLDILAEASPENLRRLLDCLATFGEGYARELTLEDFPMEEGAVRVNDDLVDIFTVMRARTFADFARTARVLVVDGAEIRFLDPHALIELKAPSTRDKDVVDVAVLRRILAGEVIPDAVDLSQLGPEDPG